MTDEQYAWLRSILGSRCPSEDQAAEDYDNLGSIKAVALQYLRAWRTELIGQPTSVTIPGAVGVGWSGNIAALDKVIASVEAGPDDPTAPGADDGTPAVVGVVFARSTYQRPTSALGAVRRALRGSR
jgi:hypothetical protein